METLRTRLEKLSEAELKAELTKAIAGNNSTGNMGLAVEKTDGEEIRQDKYFTTDENEVLTETEDGEVIRRAIRSKDQSGNLIETIISYNDGKPVNKIEKKNGNTVSSTKFTYHTESEESGFEYVTLETENSDGSNVKTKILSTDEYGNYNEINFR